LLAQLQILGSNVMALGVRRLSILAITGALIFATIAAAALFLNKPAYETLYIGLEHDDINRIGIVL
jgi:flagellar M-ring protein FliF